MTHNAEYFDYENAAAKKLTVAGSQIYIVEPTRIYESLLENPGTPLKLDETVYSNGIIETSNLTATVQGDDQDTRRIVVKGDAIYNHEYNIDDKDYFTEVRKLAGASHEIEDHLYFGNQRFLTDRASDTVVSLVHFGNERRVTIRNEATLTKKSLPSVSINLEAPTIQDIGNPRATEQFYGIFKTHVVSLNALSRALHKKPASQVFVFRPEGRYYPTGEQEKRTVSSFIDLGSHAVQQQQIEAPKPVVEKTAAEKLTFDDFGGSERVIARLREVAFAFNNPDAMRQWGAEKPQGILLSGPGGTGKTSLAQAMANEIHGELWEIKSNDIYGKWMGDSEKAIATIFEEARNITEPTVMLLDEFDALFDSSDHGTSTTVRSVVGIFKKESAALRENPDSKVVMFATTNHLGRIDPTLIRSGRFDVIEEVSLPTQQERTRIFGIKIAEIIDTLRTDTFTPLGSDIDIQKLAAQSDGKSGADIKEIVRRAKMQKAMQQAAAGGAAVAPICQADLETIIRNMR